MVHKQISVYGHFELKDFQNVLKPVSGLLKVVYLKRQKNANFASKHLIKKMHVILACIGLVVTDVPRQLLESFLS